MAQILQVVLGIQEIRFLLQDQLDQHYLLDLELLDYLVVPCFLHLLVDPVFLVGLQILNHLVNQGRLVNLVFQQIQQVQLLHFALCLQLDQQLPEILLDQLDLELLDFQVAQPAQADLDYRVLRLLRGILRGQENLLVR